MSGPGDWEICRRVDPEDDEVVALQDRFAAVQWLRRFHGDPLKMRELRAMLSQEGSGGDVSRMSDAAVADAIGALLSSGRLHVRTRRAVKRESRPYTGAPEREVQMVAPVSRPVRFPSLRGPAFDPPTFSVNVDLAAQTGALVAAAADGAPFCPL